MLDTCLFDDLPDSDRYIGGVARRICGPEFLTEVGIRCRALSEDRVVDFQDYHGTWAVWMKETFDVLRGLRRQGMTQLARQLGVRLLNAVNVVGAHVEFLYVSPDQRVHYDFRGRDPRVPGMEEIAGTNVPEEAQAWSVTAALALKWLFGSGRDLHGLANVLPLRQALEAEVLRDMPEATVLRTAAELSAAYARRGDFALNLAIGLARDRAARGAL